MEIDTVYEKARSAGAIGGKILGAGGGGFLLLYCEEQYQEKVRNALHGLRELSFTLEPQGSRIIYMEE
jgi:D-glycero-alpha-D-manno-heptose-7-phosphate kinase